jgi:hypothetical protein
LGTVDQFSIRIVVSNVNCKFHRVRRRIYPSVS